MKKRDQGSRIANRLCGVLTGTRFLTPRGYRAVETLRRGDLVATLIGRGPTFVPIVWVDRRKMQLTSEDDPMFRCPVRIRRQAVADNMPDDDLFLAPDHAIYLDARLFSTRLLINQATIVSETHRRTAEYWGIQVERHDLLIAQNLPIESLLPVNAAPFSEVRTPYLSIVGAEGIGNETPPAASLDFQRPSA